MTVEEAIRSRRSVRRYKSTPVERGLIERLIDVAVQAPSASNKQPWRFFVVDDGKVIERMAAVVEAEVSSIVQKIDGQFMDAFRAYGDYFVRFRAAPVVLAPIYREIEVLSSMLQPSADEALRQRVQTMERNSGLISVSLAVENLLLHAHETGLASSCMTGPLVAAHRLREILGVPPSWQLACLIALGYAAESPAPTPRKAASSVIRWVEEG